MLESKCSIEPLLCNVQVHFNGTESIFDGRKVLHEYFHIIIDTAAGHIAIIVMCRWAENVTVDATVAGAFGCLQNSSYANFPKTLLHLGTN
jgi:hypothetical protein